MEFCQSKKHLEGSKLQEFSAWFVDFIVCETRGTGAPHWVLAIKNGNREPGNLVKVNV